MRGFKKRVHGLEPSDVGGFLWGWGDRENGKRVRMLSAC